MGGSRVNWVQGIKYMVTERNYTQDGKHAIEYVDNELHGFIPKIYIMLLSNVTSQIF